MSRAVRPHFKGNSRGFLVSSFEFELLDVNHKEAVAVSVLCYIVGVLALPAATSAELLYRMCSCCWCVVQGLSQSTI